MIVIEVNRQNTGAGIRNPVEKTEYRSPEPGAGRKGRSQEPEEKIEAKNKESI